MGSTRRRWWFLLGALGLFFLTVLFSRSAENDPGGTKPSGRGERPSPPAEPVTGPLPSAPTVQTADASLTPEPVPPVLRHAAAAPTEAASADTLRENAQQPVELLKEPAASDAGMRYRIDKAGIQGAVRESLPDIKACYDEWVRLQPTLGGRLKVTFTIDTDDGVEGKVRRVSLGDAGIGHIAMEGCVLSVFEDLRFEAPLAGPIDVTYPIALANSLDGG